MSFAASRYRRSGWIPDVRRSRPDGCFAPNPGTQLAWPTLQKRTYPRVPLMTERWIAETCCRTKKAEAGLSHYPRIGVQAGVGETYPPGLPQYARSSKDDLADSNR
jgi:hypothetical protein